MLLDLEVRVRDGCPVEMPPWSLLSRASVQSLGSHMTQFWAGVREGKSHENLPASEMMMMKCGDP